MKTVRLTDGYRIRDGVVEYLYDEDTGYKIDYSARDQSAEYEKTRRFVWRATKYTVGADAVLVSSTDVSPNACRAGTRSNFHLSFDLDGVPGNSNPRIKSTTGWRGTTNDTSVDAHGVVTIRKIRALKNGDIAVTVA